MVIVLAVAICIVAILLPAVITGDWHADRMDRIEKDSPL